MHNFNKGPSSVYITEEGWETEKVTLQPPPGQSSDYNLHEDLLLWNGLSWYFYDSAKTQKGWRGGVGVL